MPRTFLVTCTAALLLCLLAISFYTPETSAARSRQTQHDRTVDQNAATSIQRGRDIFRFDTFGDEDFWTNTLKLHQGVAQVSPRTALAVGLKVDADALPNDLVDAIRNGRVNLDDPAVTKAVLQLNSVVGVTGKFDQAGNLNGIGIQCALCHSTVDNSVTSGIGHRLDGWANRDLNVGAIINLSPDLSAVTKLLNAPESTVRTVLQSWGPGKFDAVLFMDGKAFAPSGKSAAVLIPPAFGLAGVNLHTWTGWGSVTYWNAFVANLEMHGKGTFYDPRLKDATQFPVAAANGFDNVRNDEDQITSKLADLHFYQLALNAPAPPKGSFDEAAARRGKVIFETAKCATCHVPPLFTEPGWNMHTGAEIGIDDFQADRAPDHRYRTSPLKGLWTHQKGGFYHDGRFATLEAVIEHYNDTFALHLSDQDKRALAEYLKSL